MFKNQKNIEKNLRFFTWLGAILITLILPYMYMLGLAYYQGYMEAFGVSPDMFPLSTADTYVKAFQAVSLLITEPLRNISKELILNWRVILGNFLVCGGLLYLFINLSKIPQVSSFIKLLEEKKDSNIYEEKSNWIERIPSDIGKLFNFIMYTFFTVSMAMFLLWSGVLLVLKAGEGVASDSIKTFIKNGCKVDIKTHWSNCIVLVNADGRIVQQGYFIAKTPDEIALFGKDGSYVIRLNTDITIKKYRN